MIEQPESNGLSERELEVLHLVATGASNKEIARALSISQNTVKVHLRNIFSKTGANSRTEAAMYAVRLGLVETAAPGEGPITGNQGLSPGGEGALRPAAPDSSLQDQIRARPWLWIGLPLLILALVVLAGLRRFDNLAPATSVPNPQPVSQPRWQQEASLPAARSGLAVAVYENEVYAIAGRTEQGVVGTLTRFNPGESGWETLMDKPTAVTAVGAAVVGGRIFVPGGLQEDQTPTDFLEIFDTREEVWTRGASLPVPLSAYALVAFEGRIYVFGGWDGARFRADVYVYDPTRDNWQAATPMPTPRGYSGAAVIGDRIYVIGGRDENGALPANEEYAPDLDGSGDTPWRTLAAMPDSRYGIGVAGIANVVHVFGGQGETSPQVPWKYFPATDTWQPFEPADSSSWAFMGLVAAETSIHVIGGERDEGLSTEHKSYQAIYTIAIPVIPQP